MTIIIYFFNYYLLLSLLLFSFSLKFLNPIHSFQFADDTAVIRSGIKKSIYQPLYNLV